MKLKDKEILKAKTREELKSLLSKKKQELSDLRLDKEQNKLKNTRLLFLTRKEIAYILTIIAEKES